MSALPVAAPAPIAPLIVLCTRDGSPQQPASIPANHPLALSTSFLGWAAVPGGGAGGGALVSLNAGQMLTAFGARLSCAKAPADIPAADRVNPLTIGLSGAAWSRVLNEYITSGLLNATMTSRAELNARLSSISITNPQNLHVSASDWQLGEDTTSAPGAPGTAAVPATAPTPAVGRRGRRGYRPATPGNPAIPVVPAVAGRAALDPALNFLTLAHIFELECEGTTPWSAIAFLAGALGPVHTQAERNRPGSQAQFVARALAAGAHRHFGTTAGDDHSLSSNLRDYLLVLAHALPAEFLSAGVAPLPLRAELRDAIVYVRDADGRRSIEEARVFAFGAR